MKKLSFFIATDWILLAISATLNLPSSYFGSPFTASAPFLNDEGGVLERLGPCVTGRRKPCQLDVNFNTGGDAFYLPSLTLCAAVPDAPGMSSSHHTMSSSLKKMRVQWNGNLGGVPSSSSNVSGEEHLQIGICDRRRSLPKPWAADTAREEPFKRSWSFCIGGSGGGFKTKDASPGGNGKNAFLRKFRFRKGKKKGDHQEPGRRRMSDAAVAEAVHRVKLSQWTSVPQAKRSHEAVFVLQAHPLPRSLDARPGGSDCPDDGDGKTNAIWDFI
ncbi:hypothetical protein HPB50_010895 [Hyalomma asiaticum]|uniref:Uncharacterized protein n=1 Tax=Hyalomma asiaticum TaxID=266040 RepID=A0ACB7TI94_HYAAI|nr:hypothetical protein HPB50_010895 [Hyalomma asiaticum]